IATSAPAEASASAMACPSPRLAPVTSALRPLRSKSDKTCIMFPCGPLAKQYLCPNFYPFRLQCLAIFCGLPCIGPSFLYVVYTYISKIGFWTWHVSWDVSREGG